MRTFLFVLACLAENCYSRRVQLPPGEHHETGSTSALAALLFSSSPSVGLVRSSSHQATREQKPHGPVGNSLLTRRAIAKSALFGVPALTLLTPAAAWADDLLEAAGNLVSLLKPIYGLEAPLQAGSYDKAAVRAQIEKEISKNPVLIYSYTLSPFCTEAKTKLQEAVTSLKKDPADKIKVIELGDEWLPGLLPAEGAAIRAELGAMTGQTSMPHIFIGGKSIGGLATGTPGLAPLIKSGELTQKLSDAIR